MLKIEDLKVGDIVVFGMRENKIVSIVGTIIFLDSLNYPGGPCAAYTIGQLNRRGCILKPDLPDYKVDQPLMARDDEDGPWSKENFAYFKDGKVYTWTNGTKWSSEGEVLSWKLHRLPTQEELES